VERTVDHSDRADQRDQAATPLTPEERGGLRLQHITLRHELNEVEQHGVFAADVWAFARTRRTLLTEQFILTLHRRMFGTVWTWAGHYRTSQKNLGLDHWTIRPEIRTLLADSRVWLDKQSYPPDELAVRFHHRLVSIHPFANGNGRLSRLMADLLITDQGGHRFTWGQADLLAAGEARTRYIQALRAADGQDIAPLVTFARS
jgi:Fic-DOC domain mobile mystery protein B